MGKVSEEKEAGTVWGEGIYRLANLVVKIAGCAICSGLVWYAMRYTQFILPGGAEAAVEVRDSMWKNLLGLLAVGMALYVLFQLDKRVNGLVKYRISTAAVLVAAVWVGALSFWWIYSADRVPKGDQAFIYGAASYFQEGNFYFFGPGGYLGMFPYQLGLVMLLEVLFLFVGPYNYFAFEVICAFMAVGIVLIGYSIIKRITDSLVAQVFYCVSMMCCIPLIFYTSWVYGDLPSIFFSLLAYDVLLRYEEGKKKRWLVLLVLSIIFAILVRQHSWIFVVALILAGGIHSLRKRDAVLAITLISLLLIPQIVYTGIYTVYEIRSGVEKCEGIPFVATIAMGLQENWNGNGWYSNYAKDIYGDMELDVELTAQVAKQEIRQRLEVFRNNPSYAIRFFKSKILSQWNQPLYQSIYFNTNYEKSDKPPTVGSLAESVAEQNFSKILAMADRIQFVIFVGVLAYFAFAVKRNSNLLHHVLAIFIIGGFLFSVIWEAKARYVFPYYVIMFPVASIGYWQISQKIAEVVGNIKKPKREDNIIEFKKIA